MKSKTIPLLIVSGAVLTILGLIIQANASDSFPTLHSGQQVECSVYVNAQLNGDLEFKGSPQCSRIDTCVPNVFKGLWIGDVKGELDLQYQGGTYGSTRLTENIFTPGEVIRVQACLPGEATQVSIALHNLNDGGIDDVQSTSIQ